MRFWTAAALCTSILTLGSFSVANAETANPTTHQQQQLNAIEPSSLVSAAYHGDLEQAGVPSYNQFKQQYRVGTIDAEFLVEKAIQAGEISSELAHDEGYMNGVRIHLQQLMGTDSPN